MTRALETATLDAAAKYYAGEFIADRKPRDRAWVIAEFLKFAYKDEWEYLIDRIRGELGSNAMADFDALGNAAFTPRTDEEYAAQLAKRKAVQMYLSHWYEVSYWDLHHEAPPVPYVVQELKHDPRKMTSPPNQKLLKELGVYKKKRKRGK